MQVAGQSYVNPGLEPDYPVWCYTQPQAGAATRLLDGNSWHDTWDNQGPAIQTLNDHDYAYRVFNVADAGDQSRIRSGTFINSDHWMLDLDDISPFRLSGGILVSPDQTFAFQDGVFVVEADGAAGSDGMGGADAFYEIDVTPAAEPTGIQVDTLYGYGSFGRAAYSVGCRFETASDGPHVVCAMYDDSGRDAGGTCIGTNPTPCPPGAGRVWETQGVGTQYTAPSVQGGYPTWPIPGTNLQVHDVFRTCDSGEHDLHCRDRLRLELTQTSVHVLVNGYPVMLVDGLYAVNPHNGADNRIPFTTSGVHAYFSSWINNGIHHPTRWHWNDVNINPPGAPGHSISFCLGAARNICPHEHTPGVEMVDSGPTPTPNPASPTATALPVPPTPTITSTPTPFSTPTPTPGAPTASPTATPTPLPDCQVQVWLFGTPRPKVSC